MTQPDSRWWRDAVTYQIYLRSFADGNGGGVGDIAGIRSRLPYLADLGVDAIWINPWYPSPMADGGYDVADYRDIEPTFGTLDDAQSLIEDVHDAGLRIILDVVPNHTSDQHRWFQAALNARPGSPERNLYMFREGRGPDGDLPPNNWPSLFGGPAWERVIEADGSPGQWYLHIFAAEQPDLNWENQEVREEFESILAFWFDKGADGFRIDVSHSLIKEAGLPDLADPETSLDHDNQVGHPHWDQDSVHEIYRGWRAVADRYDPPRTFVGEGWVADAERLSRYVRPDELHGTFNFEFLRAAWKPVSLRRAITEALDSMGRVEAMPTWVLSNHDVVRHPSRLARVPGAATGHDLDDMIDLPADLELGTYRARAAIMLMLALPGAAYLYQGEELGLPEVEDLPTEVLADPIWERTRHERRGRDGCRVPLPWSSDQPGFGFSADGADPWLPQPKDWAQLAVAAQQDDPDSMLQLYIDALSARRDSVEGESLDWLESAGGDVVAFSRGDGFVCLVNLGAAAADLPDHSRVILSSGPLTEDGRVPQDTAVWLAR